MNVGVEIGQNTQFKLHEALLIYIGGQKAFVTRHPVAVRENGKAPALGPAQLLTVDFVNNLVESLGGDAATEWLPANILAKGPRSIAWWTLARQRQMFFANAEGKARNLNGKIFPHPPLVWIVSGLGLFLRALTENKRPTPTTELAVAPYWNVSANGLVCLGSMRTPNSSAVSSIAAWEKGFYESAFTHSNVGRSTLHTGGFEELWQSLAGKDRRFPAKMLIPLPQTLAQFIEESKA